MGKTELLSDKFGQSMEGILRSFSTIKMITKDEETIEVDRESYFVQMSAFIASICDDDDFEAEDVQLTEITSEILKLALEFCLNGPRELLTKPILSDRYMEEVRECEIKFFEELEFETVQELLIASTFLDNETLTDACGSYIAYTLKKTPVETLENTYNISTILSHSEAFELMDKYKYLIQKDPSSYLEAIQN
ncbi:unnamed protein product [Moneuplotes crassus]|uniref:SKP1 component POZ domain-containing protein n=1 Tax=Euplotes crassus TaxID=5936 RepID=A0AAD2D605_EUPCR|nr:unnamed protein product [Moneuplotes crassus]